jgi:hypothetical protein
LAIFILASTANHGACTRAAPDADDAIAMRNSSGFGVDQLLERRHVT